MFDTLGAVSILAWTLSSTEVGTGSASVCYFGSFRLEFGPGHRLS